MAIENITVLRVGTSEAVKNVAELRENIKALKKELDNADASFEDNARVAEDLRKNQAALRDAMYGTATSAAELIEETGKLYDENGNLSASYNTLVHAMADLKAAWRATTDEAERMDLGLRINEINNELKRLDAGVGNYSRNVGNYADSFKAALKDMPGYLGNVKKGMQDVNATIGAIQKQPLLFIVAGVASIIEKITRALKDNETAQNSVKKVMSALQPVFNVFSGILERIAGWVSSATDRLLEMAGTSTGAFRNVVTGAVGVGNAIFQFLVTPIKTAVEAVKGLGTAMKSVFAGNFKQAATDARTALEGIGDAVKNGISFKANFEAGKAIGEQFAAGVKSARRETVAAVKDTQDEATKAVEESMRDRLALEASLLKQEADLMRKGSAERLAAQKAALRAQLAADEENARQTIADAGQLERQLVILRSRYDAEVAALDADAAKAATDAELQAYRNRVSSAVSGSAEYLAAVVELRKAEADALERQAGESDADFEARRIAARKALAEAMRAVEDAEAEETRLRMENEARALEEDSIARLDAEIRLKQYELDTLHQLEGESNEAFRQRELAAEEALTQAMQARAQRRIDIFQAYASAVSGVLGSLADIYEQDGEASEKATREAKNLRIAAAVIDTISGAVTAFMQAQSLGPIAGPIIGALNAAAVTAAGVAQIAKIKNTNVSRQSSGTATLSASTTPAASVNPPSVGSGVTPTTVVRGASEEERLNTLLQDQKVILVTSELEAEQMRGRKVALESSF